MAVIKFFEMWLSEIINESFWDFTEFIVESQLFCGYFTVCQSVLSYRPIEALCVSNILKVSSLTKFLWSSSFHWICYRLWCVRWFFSFVGSCIETGLSALVEVQFTPMFSTLPWPLFHFQCPEKNMSLWTLTHPDPHTLSIRKPNTCLNN